jgi:hypothetical protein
MRQLVVTGTATVVLLLGTAAVRGQPTGGWAGQQVSTRPGTDLRIGRDVVQDDRREAGSRHKHDRLVRVYRVKRASGAWLWLVSEDGIRGWAPAVQVVTRDRALSRPPHTRPIG